MKGSPTMSDTLTKANIADAVAVASGLTHKKSVETIEILLQLIKSALESGENAMISGFRKFSVKQKAKRLGRKA
jgi:integration host factor subunit alpha